MLVVAVLGHAGMKQGIELLLSLSPAGQQRKCRSGVSQADTANAVVIRTKNLAIHIKSRLVRCLKGAEAVSMKKKRKPNPNKIPVTKADLERARKQATHEAVEFAWAIIFSVLADKEGMEYEDLQRIWAEVNALSKSVSDGYATIPDLKQVLKLEKGAELK